MMKIGQSQFTGLWSDFRLYTIEIWRRPCFTGGRGHKLLRNCGERLHNLILTAAEPEVQLLPDQRTSSGTA